MQIGSGAHTYALVEGWGKLPAGKAYGYTHGVVEDTRGRIYIHNQSVDAVCVFEPDGTFVASWGEAYATGAHGMHVSREKDGEYLYLSTTGQRQVVKTRLDGTLVWTVSTPPRPDIYDSNKKLFKPTETAVAPNGDVYVADGYGQPWIHRYSRDGEYKGSFGGPGNGRGQLSNCHGIMLDTRGPEPLVLVSDRGNSRLQYFSLDGQFVRFSAEGLVRKPCTTIQFGEELYIPDLHSRVTVLDRQDKLVAHLGEREEGWKIPNWPNIAHELRKPGSFTSPHGLHVDKRGNIYLVEWISDGRVTKLERAG